MINYDKYASGYDSRYLSEDSKTENEEIRDGLVKVGLHNCKNILDLGCGTGFLLDLIDIRGEYVGIDVSDKMLAIAREKYPNRHFWNFKAENVVAKNFDAVTSLFSIPYIGVRGVRNAYKSLTIGGVFVCVYYEKPYKSPDSVYYKKPLKYWLTVAPKVRDVIDECDRLFTRVETKTIGKGYRFSVYRKDGIR